MRVPTPGESLGLAPGVRVRSPPPAGCHSSALWPRPRPSPSPSRRPSLPPPLHPPGQLASPPAATSLSPAPPGRRGSGGHPGPQRRRGRSGGPPSGMRSGTGGGCQQGVTGTGSPPGPSVWPRVSRLAASLPVPPPCPPYGTRRHGQPSSRAPLARWLLASLHTPRPHLEGKSASKP